ncbi:hypothetical protein D3C80_1034440 [compost metagenome]
MRDGATKRGLGSLDRVDMDELEVAGRFSKQVDAGLVDGQPFGDPQFLSNIVFEFCNGCVGHQESPGCCCFL